MKRFLILLALFYTFCISAHSQAAGTSGLTYDFYRGTGATPSLNPLAYPTVVKTGVSPTINYSGAWGGTNSVLDTGYWDRFIVHWYGYINVPTAGTYTFGGNSDDGLIIKVNNTTVVDAWVDSGGAFKQGTPITLAAGVVPIEVWYYENGGGQSVNLQWYLNNTWQIVDSTYLATDATFWTVQAPTYTSSITAAQQTRKDSATVRRTAVTNNSIHIEQVGDNNTFNITQSSNNNQLKGIGQDRAYFSGNNNNVTIRQGSQQGSLTGKNLMEVSVTGDSNTLNLNQGVSADGTATADSNNHYQMLNLSGSNNSVTTVQKDSSNTAQGHFVETTISGNTNVMNLTQQGSGSKVMFGNVNGASNNVTVNQKDAGQHYLDYALTGNGHSLNAVQEGAGNHKATVSLTNSGGASTLNLNQSGTNNQTYSIQQSCAIASGCNTTVTQNQ
jgi:hypothetical protein